MTPQLPKERRQQLDGIVRKWSKTAQPTPQFKLFDRNTSDYEDAITT
jgi:hypothetical protein